MATKPKLVAIIGATGTGKSELAVNLAQRFNGEVLNADAIQLYRGLPIITNKIPEADQKGIKHHLLGCIPLDARSWTVGEFVRAALSTIDDIRSRNRLPILVGGTHYYIQSLLFHDTLATEDAVTDTPESESELQRKWPILSAPTPDILARLAAVDPQMATRWHPNDRRKIQRSLQIYLQTGKTASSVYAAQQARASQSLSLRYDTLFLWPHATTEALSKRLDDRVNRMVDAGLVDEVRGLAAVTESNPSIDTGAGICVAIGYKEFLPYITGQTTLDTALDATKVATRRYAKRQVRWIKLKLGPALRGHGNLYVLDSSDQNQFNDDVVRPAAELADKFLTARTLPDPRTLGGNLAKELLANTRQQKGLWTTKICDLCGVIGTTESDWKGHVASNKHKMLEKQARKDQQERDDETQS